MAGEAENKANSASIEVEVEVEVEAELGKIHIDCVIITNLGSILVNEIMEVYELKGM